MLTSPNTTQLYLTHSSSSTQRSPPTKSSSPSGSHTKPTAFFSGEQKMTLTIPDDVRAKAEIYVGDAAGQEKTRFLLQETGLPSGLLPLRDIIECGYVEETGFVWLKQRRKVDHYFAKAGRHVSYGAEVSAIAEPGRLKKITGVKAKEMLIWVSLNEICLDEPPSGKLVCKALGGISRSFPVEAFEADGPPPAPVKPAAAAGGGEAGKTAAAAAVEEEAKKEEDVKKLEEAKEKEAKEEEEGKKTKEDGAAAIDKVEEKLKEMSATEAVHAEPVTAKN